MSPRFSIIVPLYNKASYVKKALESIVSQTYRDWECIIINDGSSDNSLEVVQNFVDELKNEDRRLKNGNQIDDRCIDDRLTIITQKNAGVAVARNRGVKESKGEYVCFLDADDWWEPNFMEEIDKLIVDYPDAGIYATNYMYYKPGKTQVALRLERGYINYPEVYYQTGAMPVISSAVCFSRTVFDESGGFPVGIKLGEDFLLWAKTALHYKVAFCEKPLAYYNNDIPARLRATRNVHAPKYNMLFHLDEVEEEVRGKSEEVREEWKALLDKLRVNGLMDYWLDERYYEAAAAELEKVDWSRQPRNAKCQYEKPIWTIKAKRRFMQIGSYFKQKLIKLIGKR